MQRNYHFLYSYLEIVKNVFSSYKILKTHLNISLNHASTTRRDTNAGCVRTITRHFSNVGNTVIELSQSTTLITESNSDMNGIFFIILTLWELRPFINLSGIWQLSIILALSVNVGLQSAILNAEQMNILEVLLLLWKKSKLLDRSITRFQ